MPKLLFISDTHGHLQYPAASEVIDPLYDMDIDAVICMGDIYEMELALAKTIADGMDVPIYGIPGNHEPKTAVSEFGIENIHGKVVEICGVKIAGIGGCPRYKNGDARLFITDEESVSLASNMGKADILVTHSPSYQGFPTGSSAHKGLKGIDEYIRKNKPKYHFYGHLHSRDVKNFTVKEGFFKRKTITKQIGVYKMVLFDTETESISHLF